MMFEQEFMLSHWYCVSVNLLHIVMKTNIVGLKWKWAECCSTVQEFILGQIQNELHVCTKEWGTILDGSRDDGAWAKNIQINLTGWSVWLHWSELLVVPDKSSLKIEGTKIFAAFSTFFMRINGAPQ